jgi:hypothetical protein
VVALLNGMCLFWRGNRFWGISSVATPMWAAAWGATTLLVAFGGGDWGSPLLWTFVLGMHLLLLRHQLVVPAPGQVNPTAIRTRMALLMALTDPLVDGQTGEHRVPRPTSTHPTTRSSTTPPSAPYRRVPQPVSDTTATQSARTTLSAPIEPPLVLRSTGR